MEKRHMDQNHSQHIKERGGGISNGRATTVWIKQVVEGSVRSVLWGHGGRSNTVWTELEICHVRQMGCHRISSGKWIQKTMWNRMVTKIRERDQSHKTPVTSTWTVDFLTREGEGRKTVYRGWKTHPRHYWASEDQFVSTPSSCDIRGSQCLVSTSARWYE